MKPNIKHPASNLKPRSSKLKALLFTFAATLLPLAFSASQVHAQTSNFALNISPPVRYLQLKAGSQSTHTITIENKGSQELEITPQLVDFKPDNQTGQPLLLEDTTFPYLVNKSEIQQPFTLTAGKKTQLTLLFTVPNDPSFKEYPLSLVFRSKPTGTEKQESTAVVSGGIASNMVILVGEDTNTETLKISDFGTKNLIDSLQGISAQPIATNPNFSARIASGSARLKNWRKQTVVEYEIYPDGILGGSSRQLRFIKDKDLTNPINFTYDGLFLFGVYTLEIEFAGYGKTEAYTDTQRIIAFPFSVITITLLVIAIWFYTKKYTKDLDE